MNYEKLIIRLFTFPVLMGACSVSETPRKNDAQAPADLPALDGDGPGEGAVPGPGNPSEEGDIAIGLASGTGGSSSGTGGSLSEEAEQTEMSGGYAGASNPPQVYPTNPFVIVDHDPFSTFAADVDTASYQLFRNLVQQNMVPDPSSIRLEEFVNYFTYDYPAPAVEQPHPFRIFLEAAPNLVTRSTQLLRVGIQGAEVPPEEKKPANLVFLVDVSGSMQTQIPALKTLLREAVGVLGPTDTISIVTYSSETRTALVATPVSEAETIFAVIETLAAGGSTNGSAGIHLAYEQAEAAFIEGGINHVLLCTDGDFNFGLTGTDSLEQLIIEKRQTGVTLTVVGFGGANVNDEMMERISGAGNGIYGYVGSEADAEEYASERLLQTLVHIAKDVKIQVEFNPDYVFAYRLLGYENRAIADEDFRVDVIDAGEIGAGHRVTALYELVLSEGELPVASLAPGVDDGPAFSGAREVGVTDMVLVKVRYKTPGSSEADPAQEVALSLRSEEIGADFAGAGSDLQWAAAVAAFAEILKGSPYADPGAFDAMRLILVAQQERDPERADFLRLFDAARNLL